MVEVNGFLGNYRIFYIQEQGKAEVKLQVVDITIYYKK